MSVLLKTRTRFFLRHELQFKTPHQHGVPLPFVSDDGTQDMETVFQQATGTDLGSMAIAGDDVVRLSHMDVRHSDGLAVLLFRRCDPDASIQYYEDRATRNIRRADRQPNEDPAVSCHLFIDLNPVRHEPLTYRAILEEIPGLGRTYIQSLIGDILRFAKYEYTDARGREKQTYSIPVFHGIKTESIGGAMGSSGITYIELVRPGSVEGLDAEGLFKVSEQRQRLTLRNQPYNPMELLRRVRDWATGNDWNDVRIAISMPEGRSRVVTVGREAEAADVLFVRSEEIDVPTPMEICTDVINEELVSKARAIFGDNWR